MRRIRLTPASLLLLLVLGGSACSDSEPPREPDPNGEDGGTTPPGDGGTTLPDGGSPDAGPINTAVGLDTRPANPSCVAPARPPIGSGGPITLVPAFPNMDFVNGSQGVAIGLIRSRFGPTGPMRWFVVERDGDIWTFVDPNASKTGLAANGTTPVEQAQLFFDLPTNVRFDGEGGLLGVALDPEFHLRADANYIYVHYTTFPQNNVWRFRVGRDASNNFVIQESTQIFTTPSGGGNHWGGDLQFGPDGYLYLSLGDGGNGFDAAGAQRLNNTRGKILRIDPRGRTTYALPPSNPFRLSDPSNPNSPENPSCNGAQSSTRTAPCPEIYAYGFRNPWRFSFDAANGRMWVGDVGTQKEEVNLVLPGKNYGWNTCDGIYPTASCPPTTASASFIAPVAQYRQGSQVSITGGYVYRGTALGASAQGAYFFSDVYSGNVFVIDQPYQYVQDAPFTVTSTLEHPSQTGVPAQMPRFRVLSGLTEPLLVSFAEDEHRELYAVTFSNVKGRAIFKLAPASATPPQDTIPDLLSQTGCVEPTNPTRPAAGLIPYDLNAPFWSDGVEKSRWMAVPDGKTVTIKPDGDWDFPTGSVLMKNFRLSGKLIETRLLVRHDDGGWAGYTYAWSDDQTNAREANPQGESKVFGSQVWTYPSRSQCMNCHTNAAGNSLGLETRQLNREIDYGNGRVANQIRTLAHIGLFSNPPANLSSLAAFPSPFGTADLNTRARVYLHTNCAQCHRGAERPQLHFDTPEAEMQLCGTTPLMVPGNPAQSRLVHVMKTLDPTIRMPKNGGSIVDSAGVELIERWISAKTSCP